MDVNFSNSYQQQMVELKYDCIIEEPSFLIAHIKNGERFKSPVFFATSNEKISWRLRIFPNGDKEESKDHLDLYLERVLTGVEPVVVVNFKVLSIFKNNIKLTIPQYKTQVGMGSPPLAKC